MYFNGSVNGTTTVSPDTSLSGLNNAGRVAFSFTLANGNDGMAIWSNLPGDFNLDGAVDAADYILWRKTDGTPAGYNAWRTHFGQPAGNERGTTFRRAIVDSARARGLSAVMFAAAGLCLRRGRAR